MKDEHSNAWPDFLVIGAGKSGTTSLDNYLRQHPQVFMPPIKEPNFYGFELYSEKDFLSDPEELEYFKCSITDKSEYLNLFKGVEKSFMKGEVSNTYMYHDNACFQIKKYIPHVKLIAILRQPAERLYSRFLHLVRESRMPTNSFSDCLQEGNIWWKRNDLVQEGFYFKHLSKFYDHFPKSQLKVILYEDFRKDPHKQLSEVYSYLGLANDFQPDMSVSFNKSGFIKNKFYDNIFGQTGLVTKTAQAIIPSKMYLQLKHSQMLHRILNNVRQRNLHRPHLDEGLKDNVTSLYTEDIQSLSALIGKDLKHWLPKN